jgi:hypothetical protein
MVYVLRSTSNHSSLEYSCPYVREGTKLSTFARSSTIWQVKVFRVIKFMHQSSLWVTNPKWSWKPCNSKYFNRILISCKLQRAYQTRECESCLLHHREEKKLQSPDGTDMNEVFVRFLAPTVGNYHHTYKSCKVIWCICEKLNSIRRWLWFVWVGV